MSASLLRGLRILEMLRTEPLGVSEIARRLGVDKAGVSRVMRSLLTEGWIERTGRQHMLGPRALLLTAGASRTPFLERAGGLALRLREETGHSAGVLQLRDHGAQLVAFEPSASTPDLEEPREPFEHLWASAVGLALLSQLAPEDVEGHLALAKWPSRHMSAPASADEVRVLLSSLRRGEHVVERSWTYPGIGALARPWDWSEFAEEAQGGPVAVVLVGPEDVISRDAHSLAARLRAVAEEAAGAEVA